MAGRYVLLLLLGVQGHKARPAPGAGAQGDGPHGAAAELPEEPGAGARASAGGSAQPTTLPRSPGTGGQGARPRVARLMPSLEDGRWVFVDGEDGVRLQSYAMSSGSTSRGSRRRARHR